MNKKLIKRRNITKFNIKCKLKKIEFFYWWYIHTVVFLHSCKRYFRNVLLFVYFKREFKQFTGKHSEEFHVFWQDIYPCIEDKSAELDFEPHYTYHPAWAARILAHIKPEKHIDISSTRYFATIVSAFIPVEYYEYRPLKVNLSDLMCKYADITKLHFADNTVFSVSCMHVLEHIGLGRYGDKIDENGDLIAAEELSRIVQHNGHLLLVVPLSDPPKIQFNAHRMYSYRQILNMFSEFEIQQFSLIRDNEYIENAAEKDTRGCNFACGCFHFRRK